MRVFFEGLAQMLPPFIHSDTLLRSLVTIALPNHQQSISFEFVCVDPEKIQFTARCMEVIEPTTSGVSILQPENKGVLDIQSQIEGNVLIKSLLLSDIQCSSVVVDDRRKMIKCSDGSIIHNIEITSCASASADDSNVTTEVLANNINLECGNLDADGCDHYHWTALSLQKFESEIVDIKSSLSAFAMGLLTGDSAASVVDFAEISVKYSKKLLDFSLPQLAVPLLLTVLEHAMCKIIKREAYLLLLDALKKTVLQRDYALLQEWFIQISYDHLSLQTSGEGQILDFQSLTTCMNRIFIRVLNTGFTEVAKVAVEGGGAGSSPFRCLIGQLISLFTSDQEQSPVDLHTTAAINFLSGIKEVYNKDPLVSLEYFIKATWQNPGFSHVVAKAVLFLFPKLTEKKYTLSFQKGNIMLPPEWNDLNLSSKEKEIIGKVEAGELANSQAALWYLDLMLNVFCSPEKILCLLKAASHFELEFTRSKSSSEKRIFKNAALTCVHDACQLAIKLHPGIRLFTFQLALEVTLRIGTSDDTIHSEQSVDALLAAWMFKNIIYNRQFTFMWRFPVSLDSVPVFVAHFIHHISGIAQQAYLQNLLKQDECSLPLKCSLLHYQCFENALCYETEDFLFEKRIETMSKFLQEKRLTPEDVSQRILSPHILRDENGWLCPQRSLGQHLEIAELKGFSLNFSDSSPSIQLLFEPAKDGNGLLSFEDVFTILQLDCNEVFPIRFSLDPPSTTERYHPFLNFRCHPRKLQKTSFMDTLFQADYLLKFFSTGTEVSSVPPFHLRQVQDSLLNSLPERLQHVLRPNYVRGYSQMTRHRLWIEAETILFDEETSAEQYNCYIQGVKVVVRSHPLVRCINDQYYDALHVESGPHAEFAAEFTANFDEISKHFLVFARLRELSKLQFLMQKIFSLLSSLKETSQTKYEALNTELSRLRSLGPIKESHNSECAWVPAVYTIVGKTFRVYGGVTFQSTHKRYYELYGNHIPNSDDDLCWVDVHVKLINPVKSLETRPGGVYFGIRDHCRVPVYVEDPDSIVCVKLGTTASTVTSGNDDNSASSTSHHPSSISSKEKGPVARDTDEKPPVFLCLDPQESNPIIEESSTSSEGDPASLRLLENAHISSSKSTLPQDQTQDTSVQSENLNLGRPISRANSESHPPLAGVPLGDAQLNLSQSVVPLKKMNSVSSTPSLDLPASLRSDNSPTSSSLDSRGTTFSYQKEDSHLKKGQVISGSSEKYQEAADIVGLRDTPSPSTFSDPTIKVGSLTPLSHNLEMKKSPISSSPDSQEHRIDESSDDTESSANSKVNVIASKCQLPITEGEVRDDGLIKDTSQRDTDHHVDTDKSSLFSSNANPKKLNRPEIHLSSAINPESRHDASEMQAISDTISSQRELAAKVSQPPGNHDNTSQFQHSDQSQYKYPNTGDSSAHTSNLVSQTDMKDVQTTTEATIEKSSSIPTIITSEHMPLGKGNPDSSNPTLTYTESPVCSGIKASKAGLTNTLQSSSETAAACQVSDSDGDDFDTSHARPPSHRSTNLLAICDSFIASFFKNPLNIAIFGEVMYNAGVNIASESSASEMNISDFHPDALVREQVKNVIVLQHIIDAYHKQGINFHVEKQ